MTDQCNANLFKKWCTGYSGCDGGDLGSPESPSVWVCGIEWGGGHTPKSLLSNISEDVRTPPQGYDSWQDNLSYIFNWQTMKLLSAIDGGRVKDYKKYEDGRKIQNQSWYSVLEKHIWHSSREHFLMMIRLSIRRLSRAKN